VELPNSKFHEIRSVVNELVQANSGRDKRGVGNVRNMNIDRKVEGRGGGDVCRRVATEVEHFWKECVLSVME